MVLSRQHDPYSPQVVRDTSAREEPVSEPAKPVTPVTPVSEPAEVKPKRRRMARTKQRREPAKETEPITSEVIDDPVTRDLENKLSELESE